MHDFADKDAQETIFYSVDLSGLLQDGETVISATTACVPLVGADPDSATMLVGSTQIDDSAVGCLIGGGVKGVTYKATFTAQTSLGQVIKESGVFNVG